MELSVETISFLHDLPFRVLRWNSDVSQVEVLDANAGTFAPLAGEGSRWHRHEEIEITLVRSGSGVRVVGDQATEIAGTGNVTVLGSRLPHCWDFNGESSGVCIQFSRRRLGAMLPEQARVDIDSLVESAACGLDIPLQDSPGLEERMIQLAESSSPHCLQNYLGVVEVLSRLTEINLQRCRRISSLRYDRAADQKKQSEIEDVVNWILENYAGEIQLQDALAMVNMSKATFSRHFMRCTGQSFSTFLNQVRISNASRLLHTTKDPIGSIAFQTGFSTLANFNRIFRNIKGQSPSEYRRAIGRSEAN
ncbi:AraC family transcriptional regulator [Bremerella cremea]|uniref:AraC family transcriptional regulator n=1 Tax=Bremerella cremea TaxID=1031537 RepID=A0A368KNH1_9BACT|nr:AraC family transcriptional regulator [Bremerella cremea]RCS44765.1 AraC family transcriptional regulator [Bremerella cremea]